MTRDEITKLASAAGFEIGFVTDAIYAPASCRSEIERFATLVAAAERERIAAEFDRRAVYSDGTPSSGWYEPHEPAEIVRRMK